jgi:hypothetical protein
MKEEDKHVLIKYRLEQARASLDEANILFASGKTTLGVVNRAYYAMFYAVLALLQNKEQMPRKHAGALALFDREFVQKGIFNKELSQIFHNAFKIRQISDYQTTESITHEQAAKLIDNASLFIQSIEEYLKK